MNLERIVEECSTVGGLIKITRCHSPNHSLLINRDVFFISQGGQGAWRHIEVRAHKIPMLIRTLAEMLTDDEFNQIMRSENLRD